MFKIELSYVLAFTPGYPKEVKARLWMELAPPFLCVLTCGVLTVSCPTLLLPHTPAAMAFFTRINCTFKPGSSPGHCSWEKVPIYDSSCQGH